MNCFATGHINANTREILFSLANISGENKRVQSHLWFKRRGKICASRFSQSR